MAIGTPVTRAKTRIGGSTIAVSFSPSSDIAAGTKAIMVGETVQNIALTSISDSAGNTWTIHATSGTSMWVASADITTAVTTAGTITLNKASASAANYDLFVLEVSGLASGSTAFDQSATGSGTGTAYTAGPTATLSQDNEIAFGWWGQGLTSTPTQTPGTGWTGLGNASTCTAVYQIVSATTALTASETSNSTGWSGMIATFKGVAGTPSDTAQNSGSAAPFLTVIGATA